MLTQRVFQIAAGYEDANDCDKFGEDMIFKICAGNRCLLYFIQDNSIFAKGLEKQDDNCSWRRPFLKQKINELGATDIRLIRTKPLHEQGYCAGDQM
jgi:hypothetical protein